VELVGTDPYHSLHCLIDLPAFAVRMSWMADEMERFFGARPTVTDTTEMCMSASIYDALDTAGFRGTFVDGSPQMMQWRSTNYLYRYSDERSNPFNMKPPTRVRRVAKSSERYRQGPPYMGEALSEDGLFLLARHQGLSDDVGLRFSNSAWPSYPLFADAYAGWIAQAEGDFVLLNWDFENFGERHAHASGIFEFVRALPCELARRGVSMRTPGELIDRYARKQVYHLPLPVHPPVWSEILGLENRFGCEPWRDLFQLLCDVYNLARLTENPELFDLAIWLAQADTFRLLQGSDRPAVATTPQEWWRLGSAEMLCEQKQLYLNVLNAFEPYLPARLLRQAALRKPASTPTRRKSAPVRSRAGVAVPQG
jgi:alpha-amylase